MELDRYLQAVAQRWYVVGALAAVGLLGAWGYFQWSGGGSWGDFRWGAAPTARTSVAVLEPAVTKAGSGPQALVNFASIVESHALADRVVQKLGLDIPAGQVMREVSVKLSRTLVPSLTTPLYTISVDDPDGDRAVRIANAVVDEARAVFVDLNTLQPGEVDAALRAEESALRSQLAQATAALTAFEEKNGAQRLPQRIDAQFTTVNALRQTVRMGKVDEATAAANQAALEKREAEARAELDRLRSLQPVYDRLTFEANLQSTAALRLVGADSSQSGQTDPAALQAQLADARTKLQQARDALEGFEQQNHISDLPSEISAQRNAVAELRRLSQASAVAPVETPTAEQVTMARLGVDQAKNASYAANAERDGLCAPPNPKYVCDAANARALSQVTGIQQAQTQLKAIEDAGANVARTREKALAGLQEQLKQGEAELDRLRGLQPEYDRLAFEVTTAGGIYSQLQARANDLVGRGQGASPEAQLAAARARWEQARQQLDTFQRETGVADLPSQIASQAALVNDIHRQVVLAKTPSVGLDAALQPEEAELQRLLGLVPEYERLNAEVTQLSGQLNVLEGRKLDFIVNAAAAPAAQIKVLDPAQLQSNALWTVVTYVVGLVVGVFAGLVVVYLMAYFDRTPRSADDVENLVNLPVLARLPRSA